LVCSNPEILKRMDAFVPAVGEPYSYSQATRKDVLEYKLLHGAMMQTSFAPSMDRWHVQGLYVITPSGKLLAGGNTVSEPDKVAREMDKGLERYQKMSREERLLPQAPDPARDRVPFPMSDLRPPADGLILRMISRGLPAEGVNPSDTRHPFFYKIDHLWYTQKEARSFVPADLRVGVKAQVKPGAVKRLTLLHLGVYVQPNIYWQVEDAKEAKIFAEVVSVQGDVVELRFDGRVRIVGGNTRAFSGDLLGKATWNTKSQTFTAFELLAVGNHTLGEWEKPRDGSPRTAPMGILFTLNGKNVNEQMAPAFYRLYSSAE